MATAAIAAKPLESRSHNVARSTTAPEKASAAAAASASAAALTESQKKEEERRQRRKIAFFAGLGVAAVAGLAIVGGWYRLRDQIDRLVA